VKSRLGESVARTEDARLLSGRGRYTDDHIFRGEARAVVLRSPHAAARIAEIDPSPALSMPGVLAVFTGADIVAAGIGSAGSMAEYARPDGSPMFKATRSVLVTDGRVRHVGDPVAFVVAETLDAARLGAEALLVDYEPLEAVTDVLAALDPSAPAVWEACPDNTSFLFQAGDEKAVDAAFARADHVTQLDLVINRVSAAPMEPRSAVADYDPADDRLTLYCGVQNPHSMRRILARQYMNIPETKLRLVSPDMGGAFGMRSSPYPELALVLHAARTLGRPVRWTIDRSEAFIADDQARDNRTTGELALGKDGTFLALRVRNVVSMGAYVSMGGAGPATMNIGGLAGVYRTPAIHVAVRGVMTNTPSTSAYRGAGRPEASYTIERLIDAAARELKIDRAELRRRNTISPTEMPFKTGLVFTYDCGAFEQNMDLALDEIDYSGFAARATESEARGMLRGFGLANVIERAAALGEETAEIRFDPSGGVTLLMGTHSHGQGHETVFKQLLSGKLGLGFEDVRYVQGDTDLVAHGFGTFGSRSSGLGGAALERAADKVIEKCRLIVAHTLEADATDIEFNAGVFTVAGTDRRTTLMDAAQLAYVATKLPQGMEPGLHERAAFVPTGATFPNGCHVCEVEIDPDDGSIRIIRYIVVDDVGTVMNPLLLKGQIHGGIAQGVGQILMEDIAWDPDSAQQLSGSFMDYCMPRASDFPLFDVLSNPVPTALNPLGIKGAGEAGTVGAMPCLMNAIIDALSQRGIYHLDMPATPNRVWHALQSA
jgi:aerobic carbon-monoxide dehydrogenase large subunit